MTRALPPRAVRRSLLAAGLLAALAGCSLAPTYRVPETVVPAAYKEVDKMWVQAAPADAQPRGDWWSAYGDRTLGELETRLDQHSPTLAAALARYDMATAYAGQLRAGLFPSLDLGANPQRIRQSNNKPLRGANQPDEYTSNTAGLALDYELDLWGRIRNQVKAGNAQAAASAADLASAKLSLEAELADLYIQARGLDIQARILTDSIGVYRQGLQLTKDRFAGGITSMLDVTRAQAQLSDAQAQASDVAAQRALAEHAIASLVGEPASSFSLPADATPLTVPAIPLGIPSTLLQRRPDIAAAERRTFAANAQIGVARAAFFPSLSLSGQYGWQNMGGGSLLTAGNRFWAVGPLAALNLFDGGLRRAQVREARAAFDEASAQYRSTVLGAFQQVEDNLSLLKNLGQEAEQEQAAADAATQSQTIATNRYREGAVSYLDVVTAQTVVLDAQRMTEAVRTRRLQASVDLIRAVGGGWSTAALAQAAAGGHAPMTAAR
ncbi:efflux transporter outer membrane subunit [Frateuria defendens]|uniref:efflux transporter outer membrane subunit n=1 Tax=Frateuria defendens TaxID=2219559 RepID=UPI00066FD616|nr:efflux transporter outer membrane subunit [Frateuria defendens]